MDVYWCISYMFCIFHVLESFFCIQSYISVTHYVNVSACANGFLECLKTPVWKNSDWGGLSGGASHPSEFNGSKPFDLTFPFTLLGPTTSHHWVRVLVWMDHTLKCQHVRHFFAMAGPPLELCFRGSCSQFTTEYRCKWTPDSANFSPSWDSQFGIGAFLADFWWCVFWGCLGCAASSSWLHGTNASTGLATALRPPVLLGGALIHDVGGLICHHSHSKSAFLGAVDLQKTSGLLSCLAHGLRCKSIS